MKQLSEKDLMDPLIYEIFQSPGHSSNPKEMDVKLEEWFEELDESYFNNYTNNGNSLWQQKIRESRRNLVNDGYLYSAKEVGYGVWMLTKKGIKYGQSLTEKFDIDISPSKIDTSELDLIDIDISVKEGRDQISVHKSKERNGQIVKRKKDSAFRNNSNLPCEVCGFSFSKIYGELGEMYIEAHHIKPLSDTKGETETTLDDLILLCSNCHNMIHRKKPWLTIDELREIIVETKN